MGMMTRFSQRRSGTAHLHALYKDVGNIIHDLGTGIIRSRQRKELISQGDTSKLSINNPSEVIGKILLLSLAIYEDHSLLL